MFDIGWTELLMLGALSLIVVGPKELPRMLRSFGKYTAQARGMARDFQRSMEQAAREADITDMKELRETADSLRNIKSMSVDSMLSESNPKRATPSAGAPSMRVDEGPAEVKPDASAAASPSQSPAPSPAPASGAREG